MDSLKWEGIPSSKIKKYVQDIIWCFLAIYSGMYMLIVCTE